jgi:hypothetical protein
MGPETNECKLLCIGAGASFGARINFKNRPPVGDGLLSYLSNQLSKVITNPDLALHQYQSIFDDSELKTVDRFFKSALARNLTYEEAVTALLQEEDSLNTLVAINRFLAFAFNSDNHQANFRPEEFSFGQDLYSDLVAKLDLDPSWIVMSLNYETLFEQALVRANRPFHYSRMALGAYRKDPAIPSVEIFKIHGSITWFGTQDHSVPREEDIHKKKWSVLDWNKKHNRPVHKSVDYYSTFFDQVLYELVLGNRVPIMAHFASGKYTFGDLDKLEQVRENCIQKLKAVRQAYIVGIRAPKEGDDPTLEELLTRLNERVISTNYINPSIDDCAEVRRRFPNFRILRMGLSEWLDQIGK